MMLSIVVTTYNRADVLKRLLVHLEQQQDRAFEVVVAIDGSQDGTHEMLAACGTTYPLRWVDTQCHGYGLAMARNMEQAHAEVPQATLQQIGRLPQVTQAKALVF